MNKGTAMQIEKKKKKKQKKKKKKKKKTLINDRLRVSKVSWKFHFSTIYIFSVINPILFN